MAFFKNRRTLCRSRTSGTVWAMWIPSLIRTGCMCPLCFPAAAGTIYAHPKQSLIFLISFIVRSSIPIWRMACIRTRGKACICLEIGLRSLRKREGVACPEMQTKSAAVSNSNLEPAAHFFRFCVMGPKPSPVLFLFLLALVVSEEAIGVEFALRIRLAGPRIIRQRGPSSLPFSP